MKRLAIPLGCQTTTAKWNGYVPVARLPAQRIATLLLEGIIFRLARILEDLHREFGIERVYLFGGLSSLPCCNRG